ncbi:MAG: HAD-IB family hydrolase [Actinomycetota bacterium]|nr:HAD-IB family hydrolase [Actinomycetota bacterium]
MTAITRASGADLSRWSAVPLPAANVTSEPAQPVVVSAFDVDGTVTRHDCVVPFLRLVGGTWPLVAGLARQTHRLVPAVLRRDRDRIKAIASSVVFRGRPVTHVDALGRVFAATVSADGLRDDTIARLRWHQRRGDRTVLVSASFAVYLRPLAERLGVDHVLATELEHDDAGRCTGRLIGGNCRGVEKRRRLHALLADAYGGRSATTVWAYGDSAGDRELLDDADHAVWARRPIAPTAEDAR